MLNLEGRCQSIQEDINEFMVKYNILRDKGLPNLLVIHDKLMTHDDYIEYCTNKPRVKPALPQ